jgi:hypothetical protein
MMQTHHERLHPRLRASTRVDWWVAGASTHVVSNLGNVSAGGARVVTSLAAPVGARIELRVLTDLGPIATRGSVAWRNQNGMGIRFEA